jgi:hypothetical protein
MDSPKQDSELASGTSPEDLCLPQSGLFLKGLQLIRRDSNGKQIATLELGKLQELRCKRSVHWGTVLFILFCVAGIGLMVVCGSSRFWTLLVGVPLGLCALLALIGGLLETELVIVLDTGKVAFPVSDPPSDAQAFVMSIRERVASSAP